MRTRNELEGVLIYLGQQSLGAGGSPRRMGNTTVCCSIFQVEPYTFLMLQAYLEDEDVWIRTPGFSFCGEGDDFIRDKGVAIALNKAIKRAVDKYREEDNGKRFVGNLASELMMKLLEEMCTQK